MVAGHGSPNLSRGRMKRKLLGTCLALMVAATSARAAADFGAYYTKLHTGQEWEAYCRTGPHPDVVVQLATGQLVFWRGNSYLPYWKSAQGQWNLTEIIPRHGDGTAAMPDRVNVYSHAEVITNTPSEVVVHWRYLSSFTAGNPHGAVSPNNFVDELFTITPNGHVERVVKKGTEKTDDWNDPLNQTTQALQLDAAGVAELRRQEPGHSVVPVKVAGNPGNKSAVGSPALWFKFDEGLGDQTTEEMTKTSLPVAGPKTLWKKGIAGTALQFDGYHTAVALPAAQAPAVTGGSLTLEGWFALGAYPWNWAPLVQQGDDKGYFLGVDSHGYPGFMVQVDGTWQQLTVPNKPPYKDANHLELFKWYQMAGTYNKSDGLMRLFVNGQEVARKTIGTGGLQGAAADAVRVGKAGILRTPTNGTHDTLPSDFSLDGLLDEVKVYTVALDAAQIARSFANFNPGPEIVAAPDMPKRQFPTITTDGKFRAIYTRLPYYETWDNLWRFGPHADVVVGFDQMPTKFVFWRGVSYIPMMVNESGQWFTNEFDETGFTKTAHGDCEPMSDKGCWDSHARIIENNSARVVIHWRYCLENPSHDWANMDDHGWGDIADWYYYIYPDGVASKNMRCYSSQPASWHEWDEQIAVFGEGQHPEGVVKKTPVMTLVDKAGHAVDYDWNPNPPQPDYPGKIIQMIHLTGQYSPFSVQNIERGDIYKGERTWYAVFPSWNHWPTSQINSSGRNASFPDRAAHCSISHLFWPYSAQQAGPISFQEKILLEGMSDQPAATLTRLARSWLNAPPLTAISGGTAQGYAPAQRAYDLQWAGGPMEFAIAADDEHPIENLCFQIKGWKSRTTQAVLTINHVSQVPGRNFRQGVNIDTDGTYTLIVWVGLSAAAPQNFVLTEK